MSKPFDKFPAILGLILEHRLSDPDPSPLDFLRSVYCNEAIPLQVRLRAAIEALPFVHPKLAVTVAFDGKTFGDRLERAVERTGKTIEHQPEPTDR